MIITRNRLGDGDKFRLIILSRNRCTILSQICESNVSADAIFCRFAVLMMSAGNLVSDTFFEDDTARGVGNAESVKFKLCVASPTYLVQMESPGARRVYHYPNGFRFLNFNSVHG
jgi:hypothetical protein